MYGWMDLATNRHHKTGLVGQTEFVVRVTLSCVLNNDRDIFNCSKKFKSLFRAQYYVYWCTYRCTN